MPPRRPRARSSEKSRVAAVAPPAVAAPVPIARQPIPYRLILAIIGLVIATGVLIDLFLILHVLLFHLLVALFIALVLTPAIARLQRLGAKRGLATTLVVGAVVIGSLGVGTLIATPLAKQGVKFATQAPTYLAQAEKGQGTIGKLARRFHLQNQLKKAGPGLSKTLSNLSGKVLTFGRRIASAAFTATIVMILAIFMLVEGPKAVDWAIGEIPERHRDAGRRIGSQVLHVVSGYTTGVVLLAVLNGAVAGIAMAVTGTPFVLPLAVWATVIDVLPIVGGLLAIVPAGLFAFAHGLGAGIAVVAAMLTYQQVKNHLLYPVVVGRRVRLNSLLVLVAVLAGTELGGIAGAVLAIPVAGSIQVLTVEIVHWRREVRAQNTVEGAVVAGSEPA